MTATRPLKMSLPLNIKKEQDERMSENNDESEETDDDDDNSSTNSLLQPSILDKDCFSNVDPHDEFLHLTSMVRRVYFSYLHKSVINNYNVCCTSKNEKNISRAELKKFASRLELHAVRASLEASLYRQAMLKIIADVKSNTAHHKIHKKLAVYLDTPPNTTNIAVQTCFDVGSLKKSNSCRELDNNALFSEATRQPECESKTLIDEKLVEILQTTDGNVIEINPEVHRQNQWLRNTEEKPREIEEDIVTKCHDDNIDVDHNVNTSVQEIFGELSSDQNPMDNGEEESRDSLMRHMEDMFCESEDSSDLMTLIEKHSGVSKSNMDTEIGKMCPEIMTPTPIKSNNPSPKLLKKKSSDLSTSDVPQPGGKRKMSFKNYKRMKKRALEESGALDTSQSEEVREDKQTRKMRGIWFVERVHQVSKLKAKMMDLSARNYRKHGRLRTKFKQLFGDSDEEEMMPDSPIHIEEHLTACKERIAPWVVKYLMPFYSKKLIKDRLLFKAVAKHIADMLIIENTFPEEDCVSQYIKDYFRNKPCINLEADIYI